MKSSQALNLIVKLAGFKLLARANRFGSDSELAREVHDSVLAVLDGYRAELAELIRLRCQVARETDPDRQEDLTYHLRSPAMFRASSKFRRSARAGFAPFSTT